MQPRQRHVYPTPGNIFAIQETKKRKSDNGLPFIKNISKTVQLKLSTSTPLWPQRNPVIERFMKLITISLENAEVEGKNWRQELQRLVLQNCSTPYEPTRVASCRLLLNQTITWCLPELPDKKAISKHAAAKRNLEKKKHEYKES